MVKMHITYVYSLTLIWLCKGLESTDQPEQIHINFGHNTQTMVVMWATRSDVTGWIQYDQRAEILQFSAGSEVAKLPAEDYKAAKYIHKAELKNLTEGRRYFYKVVSRHKETNRLLATSDVYSFKVPQNDFNRTMKFLVYGDMGANVKIPTYKELERSVTQEEITAILHVGDFAYDLHIDYGRVGDQFMKNIQPFAARVPYMTCPGNHEIHGDFTHYRTRFSHPGKPWPIPLDKLWYSFDLGLVHFISYSTEVFFSNNQQYVCTQFDWLLKDLTTANENRNNTPWIIAIGHRPMYCSNNNGNDCSGLFFGGRVQHGLEDLFHAQGVDLIIEAHEHSYERLWPMYYGRVVSLNYTNPRAPTHVISGAAGNVEGIDRMPRGYDNPWSAVKADNTSRFTFGTLEIHNRTHLNFKQIKTTSGEVIDSFWLVQQHHGPFIQNVNCTGVGNHRSCYCPFPFFFVIFQILFAISLAILVGLIIFTCYWCRSKYRKSQRKKCADALKNNAIHRIVTFFCCLRTDNTSRLMAGKGAFGTDQCENDDHVALLIH